MGWIDETVFPWKGSFYYRVKPVVVVVFCFFFNIYSFLRDREGEGQREKETQNLKQAPGSELSTQSLTQGSNPWTVRSWPGKMTLWDSRNNLALDVLSINVYEINCYQYNMYCYQYMNRIITCLVVCDFHSRNDWIWTSKICFLAHS